MTDPTRLGLLAFILFATSSAACEATPPPAKAPASVVRPLMTALGQWEYAGPGGLGAFTDIQRFPGSATIWLAASDVGGAFLSLDAGASWKNVSAGVTTGNVQRIEFSRRTSSATGYTILLGTETGIFFSQEVTTASFTPALRLNWTLTRTGVVTRHCDPNSNVDSLGAPVLSLVVDPTDRTRVWMGLGLEYHPRESTTTDRYDWWKVYSSRDGGLTWTPSLRFNPRTPFSVCGEDAGHAYQIVVHPDDGNRVWVASDQGLYATTDGGTTWTEIGVRAPRHTRNQGASWTTLATGFGCVSGESCLPITTNGVTETHPNLRDLALTIRPTTSNTGGIVLYAAAWDRGYVNPPGDDECDGDDPDATFYDEDLDYFRGGIYTSYDSGTTWRWQRPTNTQIEYRCTADDEGGSNFFQVEAPTRDLAPGYLAVGASGLGNHGAGGVYLLELRTGTWTRYTGNTTGAAPDEHCDDNDCFEGGASGALYGVQKWPDGAALRAWWDDGAATRPTVLFSYRGYTMGTWNAATQRYDFDHLHNNYDAMTDTWQSTGLDDVVAFQVVVVDDEVFVGIDDGGLMVADTTPDSTTPASWQWQRGASAWPVTGDESKVMVLDGERIVASVRRDSTDQVSILRSDTTRTEWTVLGGFDGESEIGGLDLTSSNDTVNGLAVIDSDSDSSGSRYLAATTNGLWFYDERVAAGVWQLVSACPSIAAETKVGFSHIVTSSNAPTVAFVTLTNLGSDDGVYAVDVDAFDGAGDAASITCDLISDPATVKRPTGLTLAGDRLIVGAQVAAVPTLFFADVAWTTPNAVLTWSESTVAVSGYGADSTPSFEAIAASPTDSTLVVAGLQNTPTSDDPVPQFIYVSVDGGQTFEASATFQQGLPNKDIYSFTFTSDGAYLYTTTSASVFRTVVAPPIRITEPGRGL